MTLRRSKTRIKVSEVTVSSSLRLFQYGREIEGQGIKAEGGSTGSEVSIKLTFPDGISRDDIPELILKQKWALDHQLLEMEHARGGLSTSEFRKRVNDLEEEYLLLFEDDEDDEDDED